MGLPDTKDRILDAAERLFAREGFHCTPLRRLTREAKVNLAAVNYHFGSKNGLLESLIERRLGPLNELRQARLDEVEAAAKPSVEAVLRAFIEPTLRFRDSAPGAGDFTTLIGRALAEPDDTVRRIFLRHMEPVLFRLFRMVAAALPQVSPNLLYWRLHFALGAMGHTMCLGNRIQLMPPGVDPAVATDGMIEMLVAFVTAGMEGA